MQLYHVTDRENATAIASEGFLGGWGDVGFGIYFYGNVLEARSYGRKGGWDKSLSDPVIIEIEVQSHEIEKVIPHPEWPNPDDYNDIWFKSLEDHADRYGEDVTWAPTLLRVIEDVELDPSLSSAKKGAPHAGAR